jgi:hypothetical protein
MGGKGSTVDWEAVDDARPVAAMITCAFMEGYLGVCEGTRSVSGAEKKPVCEGCRIL